MGEAIMAEGGLISTLSKLLAGLPSKQFADRLTRSYFRRAAWSGTPIMEGDFNVILTRLYDLRRRADTISETRLPVISVSLQQLSLVFAVLAMGSAVDMEQLPCGPKQMELLQLAQKCLGAGRFLAINTLAGLAALVCHLPLCTDPQNIVCKALTYTDAFLRWDYVWQLWGIAERIIQAVRKFCTALLNADGLAA